MSVEVCRRPELPERCPLKAADVASSAPWTGEAARVPLGSGTADSETIDLNIINWDEPAVAGHCPHV